MRGLTWPLKCGSSQGPDPETDDFPELTIGEVARRAGVATSDPGYVRGGIDGVSGARGHP